MSDDAGTGKPEAAAQDAGASAPSAPSAPSADEKTAAKPAAASTGTSSGTSKGAAASGTAKGPAGVAAAKAAALAASRPAPTVLKSGIGEVVYRPSLVMAPMTRRGFFGWLSIGCITFTAAMGGFLTAATRFMFPNVLFEPPSTFKAGNPNDYVVGQVDERWKEAYGVWLVRTETGFYALSTTCTHLGCTPNWLAAENKFKCPCHGSGFYPTGINFEGPAPRPLERYRIAMTDDGQLFIDKNIKFQQEKGQWESPGAFLDYSA